MNSVASRASELSGIRTPATVVRVAVMCPKDAPAPGRSGNTLVGMIDRQLRIGDS